MKRFVTCCLAVALLVVLSMAGAVQAAEPKRGGTLKVAILADAWSLDPIHIQTTSGERIYHDVGIGEALYDWDVKKGVFIPRLATELPKISKDGKTYTIPLRKGVKFHDGSKFDAKAMAYSLMRIKDPENKSYIRKKYALMDKAEAADEYTLRIILNEPDNAFMAKLCSRDVCPVSKAVVDKYGKDFGTKAVSGTGPYKLVEWLQGDHIIVEKNKDHWNKDLGYVDKIVFKLIPEEATALMQLRLGEVHILEDVSRKDIKTLKEDKNVEVKLVTGVQHEQIYLNTARPPFDDVRVRRAVAHAIDRQAIIDGVFEGYAVESVGPYHPWFWTHNPNFKQPYPYDPAKAKKLLKEAGYGPNKPLRFELMATNQDMFVDQAVMIQAFLQEVGAQVDVLPLDKSTLFDRVYVRKAFKGKPEMYAGALEDWGSSVVDPESAAERLFTSGSGSNKCFYKNPKVDELFKKVNLAKSLDDQKKIYYETEALIAADIPTIWICNPKDAAACRVEVKGYAPDGEWRLPLDKVWLEK